MTTTTPERRKQVAEAVARLNAKRKEAGLLRRNVWAHPDDWPEIRALETEMQEARKRGLQNPSFRAIKR